MTDSGLEALAAEQAVEAKLAEAGADTIRRSGAPESAPDSGTPEVVKESPQNEGQPRNELGQFTNPAVEEVAADTQTQDPAIAAFLNKYGGDVDKALAGAAHLQRKAGEQSNELGDLRRMVDELSQLRETVQADYQNRQVPIDQGTVDWFDEQLMQNPQGAVEWARQQNNNILFQRGLANWKEMQPYEASVYTNNLNNAQLRQEFDQRLSAASQLPADANMHLALNNVRAAHPEFTNYDDAIGGTLEKYAFMQNALSNAYQSGDRQQLEGAIETLYALAQRDTLANIALTGNTPDNTTASAEVVEPTTSESHESAPEPSAQEQFKALFKQTAEEKARGFWDRGRPDTFVAE